jgi:hypothetical protein
MLLRAQRSESREWDEYDYTTLFVELELVFALEAAKLLRAARFPTPAAVRELAQAYIAEWDDYAEADGPGPARRQVILDTFERFATICEAHGGTSPMPEPPKPVAKQATPKATAKSAKPKKPAKKKPAKKR